ncbi:blood vessel epicardial substance-like isoform X2 [Daktulosphaira vitifoliae]|uniref:blood vessel epicardial substance-like isoform X2 n=1 Tax=Daktulosphaira vitifoliae TaxID=58002 RepID=UPI0021AAF800|nr:blood vessel epicardial substance-like isoform X2 [Daktulosphaira vitifoliae]XP_050531978.1 blood vessel epicardial substance-like isoform X2 [Daktulosphaira vitifoliae]
MNNTNITAQSNYSCYDGGGCSFNDYLAWSSLKTFLDTATVLTLNSSCLSTVFNHPYFHLSQAIMFICYMLPFGSPSRLILFIRLALTTATAIMALWARNVQCWIDSLLWNSASFVVNLIYVFVLFYQLKPIKFSDELEQVYKSLFLPLKVSRKQFRKIISCMKMVRPLKTLEIFAEEKVTRVDSLSLVLSGKLVISQNGNALHIVFPYQFLDSPEWFGVSTDEFFQVSVTAVEDSRVLLWHRDKLRLSIITDQFLYTIFDHILGRDVVKKLMQVSETMSNGHSPNQWHESEEGELLGNPNDEKQTVLYLKRNGDGQAGIETILKRELQVDPNGWRLSRIEEVDHETPV